MTCIRHLMKMFLVSDILGEVEDSEEEDEEDDGDAIPDSPDHLEPELIISWLRGLLHHCQDCKGPKGGGVAVGLCVISIDCCHTLDGPESMGANVWIPDHTMPLHYLGLAIKMIK